MGRRVSCANHPFDNTNPEVGRFTAQGSIVAPSKLRPAVAGGNLITITSIRTGLPVGSRCQKEKP